MFTVSWFCDLSCNNKTCALDIFGFSFWTLGLYWTLTVGTHGFTTLALVDVNFTG